MIFVTVGTHEQPFNRLIKEVDRLVADGKIKEKVVIQTGFSTYIPEHCEWHKMMSFNEMNQYVESAHMVITHGGPASFIEVLQKGKIPIVVPRMEKYGEHINNHQVEFVKLIDHKMHNIIPVYNMKDLNQTRLDYDDTTCFDSDAIKSNNVNFIKGLEEIVNGFFH